MVRLPRRFLWSCDVLCLVLAFLVAHAMAQPLQRLLTPGGLLWSPWLDVLSLPGPEVIGQFRPLREQLWILLAMAPATIAFMELLSGYRSPERESRTRLLFASVTSPVLGLSVITLVVFAARGDGWSRLLLFLFAVGAGVAFVAYRLLLRHYRLRRLASGYYARNVLLIGQVHPVEWMTQYFADHIRPTEYRIIGYLRLATGDSRGAVRETGKTEIGLRELGDWRDLGSLLVHEPIREVVAIQSSGDASWLKTVIEDCDYFRVTLRIVSEALLLPKLKDLRLIYHTDPLGLPEVLLKPKHLDSEAVFVKRLMDLVLSAVLLILMMPLFLLIAIAIKLMSPHEPILYRWRVVGLNGQPFTGYKFTTMVVDAEERMLALRPLNEMTGPVFKIRNDPRTTPLGRFLRQYSLNELPQLWSVLKGDMSLVGPRPAFRHELERYELWHKRKLSVRPGITCLWQVRGRNRISRFDDWVRMDLEYIDNWSLWLDLKILARTVWVVIGRTGY